MKFKNADQRKAIHAKKNQPAKATRLTALSNVRRQLINDYAHEVLEEGKAENLEQARKYAEAALRGQGVLRAKRQVPKVRSLDGLHTIGNAETKTAAGYYARGYNRAAKKRLARVVRYGSKFYAVSDEEEHRILTGQLPQFPGLHTIGRAQTKTAAGHYVKGYNREARRTGQAATAHVINRDGSFYAVVPEADRGA